MFQQTSFLNNFIALNKVSSRTLRIIFQMFKTLEALCFQKKKQNKKTSCSSKVCKITGILLQFLKLACVCYFVCFRERYFRLILTIFNFRQHCHVCTSIPEFCLEWPSRIPHQMEIVIFPGSLFKRLPTVTW